MQRLPFVTNAQRCKGDNARGVAACIRMRKRVVRRESEVHACRACRCQRLEALLTPSIHCPCSLEHGRVRRGWAPFSSFRSKKRKLPPISAPASATEPWQHGVRLRVRSWYLIE